MNKIFETNGKTYKTDSEVLDMLYKLNKEGRDDEAHLVFTVCKMTGRIVEA